MLKAYLMLLSNEITFKKINKVRKKLIFRKKLDFIDKNLNCDKKKRRYRHFLHPCTLPERMLTYEK